MARSRPEKRKSGRIKKKDFASGLLKKGHLGAPCKEIGILDSRKFLLVDRNLESGKIVLVEYGILGFGIRNAAQGVRNPTNESPSSIDKDWNPDSRTVLDSVI